MEANKKNGTRKIDWVKVSRILMLVLMDIVLVNVAQFFALFIRFEFRVTALLDSGFLTGIIKLAPFYMVFCLLVFWVFHLYNSLWKYAGVDELVRIGLAVISVVAGQCIALLLCHFYFPRSFPILNGTFTFALLAASRFSYRLIRREKHKGDKKHIRTMIIGGGQAGSMAIREFQNSERSENKVVCIIDDDEKKHGQYLMGVKIVGGCDVIVEAAKAYRVSEIVLTIPRATNREKKKILSICQKTGCRLRTLPALYQLANGEVSIEKIRNVEIEDLLGRDTVKVNIEQISGYIAGKTVLVTGGGGSIGSELCRQIAHNRAGHLIIFDIYENNAYSIEQELKYKYPALKLTVLIGSVRDEERVKQLFSLYHPDIVYHAAAHKHVPLMENSPNEAVKNNVFGTYNVAKAADAFGAETFVLISTDKAVNPTNVMGATKRICEMIVQLFSRSSRTKFVAVRFGNVLGSNGSVIPLFRRQIAEGGPVTVTHKDVIRYFMTIPEAVSLVMQAGAFAKGGEIFILDMGEPVKIDDLARHMIKLSGLEPEVDIPIVYTGLRPGEKLFEELLMDEEGIKSTENHMIFIGHPLKMDEGRLKEDLQELWEACEVNSSAIREALEKTVSTYHPACKNAAQQAEGIA